MPSGLLLAPLDLIVIFAYLALTLAIGVLAYRKGATSEDFFFAGRSVGWLPVAISILATDFSAITFLGIPAFVYQRDLQMAPAAFILALIVVPIVAARIAPFYMRQNLSTSYEYLERRFHWRVRTMASLVFLLMRGIYLGIVIYAPSLVIATVTGLPLTESILMMGLLTSVYTAVGGIRAVIWTDVMQFIVIVIGLIAIVGLAGSSIEGGWGNIWPTAATLGKTKIADFTPSLNQEFTIYAVMIGISVFFMNTYSTDQVILQRYLTTKSIEECKRALRLEAILLIPVLLSLQFTGLVLTVYYHQRPAEAAGIQMKDALLPYFTVHNLPAGAAGLVIASIFAAAMSTVSGGVNSLATVTVQDFYRRHFNTNASEQHYLRVGRGLTFAWGAVATGLALVARHLGELANAYNKVNSYLGGVMLGIFVLGMATRRATARSVVAAAVLGFATVVLVSRATSVSWFWYGAVGFVSTFSYGWLLGSPAAAREGEQ